ncbi:HNH endonuclease family protein [hydrothermal vent metagenome]|uniref:HNH endonuclease family protein n=1 Tax=hydrothermal vent metagenome TaxID=652676 RepID=A0A3B1D371_9ZZZZ
MVSSTPPSLQSNVLTLNKLYLAVQVISAKRAFCLLWKGLAEVVSVENGAYLSYDFASWQEVSELKIELNERHEHDDWLLAVNFQIQVPRVIRLLTYDRVPRQAIKFNRRNVFLRDDHHCQYCGNQFHSHRLSLDHVLPRSRGGKLTWENVVSACHKCNVRKGNRTPNEAGMNLSRPPKKPQRNPVLAQQLSIPKYSCWKNFVR